MKRKKAKLVNVTCCQDEDLCPKSSISIKELLYATYAKLFGHYNKFRFFLTLDITTEFLFKAGHGKLNLKVLKVLVSIIDGRYLKPCKWLGYLHYKVPEALSS